MANQHEFLTDIGPKGKVVTREGKNYMVNMFQLTEIQKKNSSYVRSIIFLD